MGFFVAEVSSNTGEFVLTIQIVLAILVASHVLLKKQDPYVCMGWLLAVALFPILTAIMYLGVGVNDSLVFSPG